MLPAQRDSNRQWTLKPQDLAVLFKLIALKDTWLPYKELARQMYLSPFEAHRAVQRLLAVKLLRDDDVKPKPVATAYIPFISQGAIYVFPPVRTELTVGFPTAHGASPLKEQVMFADQFPPVWPHPDGIARGPGLLPLYDKLPLAANADSKLYEMLALFDAMRIGQSRERELAGKFLAARLS